VELLFLITARGGSKGIPFKNIKIFNGKPLICHSIDVARQMAGDDRICVSSDDSAIISTVEAYGLRVPFVRPAELSGDTAGSYEVIRHALRFYEERGSSFDAVVLLQPTSPFRKKQHLKEAVALFDESVDMVVSVKQSEANPYYNLFEEVSGSLQLSKKSESVRRQDAPPVYQFNGSIYVINVNALKNYKSFNEFKSVKKYLMDEVHSMDLDKPLDWVIAETLLEKGFV
jgi:CMP-N,N'-diacetyllegionaminic acid synthase